MIFGILWFIGLAIGVITRIIINALNDDYALYNDDFLSELNVRERVVMNVLAIISIVLILGILAGASHYAWLETVEQRKVFNILIECLMLLVIYVIGHLILGLYHFKWIYSQICFIAVFIISTFCWSKPICNYMNNIEVFTETVVTSTDERQLMYFCNIPVQDISGSVHGNFFMGGGTVSGSISTSDELSYWYINENGEGLYDSASADNSKIIFISEDEKPYVEITSYLNYTKTINHNNEKEESTINKAWSEYIFYLPKEIMQYQLE